MISEKMKSFVVTNVSRLELLTQLKVFVMGTIFSFALRLRMFTVASILRSVLWILLVFDSSTHSDVDLLELKLNKLLSLLHRATVGDVGLFNTTNGSSKILRYVFNLSPRMISNGVVWIMRHERLKWLSTLQWNALAVKTLLHNYTLTSLLTWEPPKKTMRV